MKLTRKQKIQQQREWSAERVMGPIRDAIDRGDLTVGPLPRVQIVNREHPHFEEYGRFTGKIIKMKFGLQNEMAEVRLEHCRHGTDACFVSKGDVKQVAER